jgi:hypothetical protein
MHMILNVIRIKEHTLSGIEKGVMLADHER